MAVLALSIAAAISVLAFGGVRTLDFLPAQIILLFAALAEFWRRGWPRLPRPQAAVLSLLVMIPILQIIPLQIGPLPAWMLDALAPGRALLAGKIGNASALAMAPSLSLVPAETVRAALKLYAYLLAFVLAFASIGKGDDPRWMSRFLIGLGLCEAAYGLFQYLTGWQYIYTYQKTSSFANAGGTYINYNHFAGLLEMVLPFLVVQLWIHPRHGGASGRGQSWRQALATSDLPRRLVRLALFAVVMLALIFSRSRSGILSGIAGIAVAALLTFSKGTKGTRLVPGLAISALLFAYLAWIGLSPVLVRFETLRSPGADELSRIVIWKDTLALIRDFPLLGSGLGTYSSVSLHYQTIPGTLRYEHAHNDYLEFAADIGIPAAALLFAGLWALAIGVARRAYSLERWRERQLAAACAGALLALLLHALTDFNLQIPANALIFSWIAGTAAALVARPRAAGHRASARSARTRSASARSLDGVNAAWQEVPRA